MNFALGVGYIMIGIVSIIIFILIIWILTKLYSKLPKIKINKKLKNISEDIFAALFAIMALGVTITSICVLAYEIGKSIVGMF